MRTLALTTSGYYCGIALLHDGELIAADSFVHEMKLLQSLVPRVDNLLARTGGGLGDVDLVAVDAGPGSFTGVRIGVTTAKALAWAMRIPGVGVGSLEALARQAPAQGDMPVLACVRSRKGTAYWQCFRPGSTIPIALNIAAVAPLHLIPEALIPLGLHECAVVCADLPAEDQGTLLASLKENGVRPTSLSVEGVLPSTIGLLALHTYNTAGSCDPLALAPCYVAPPDIGAPAQRSR